jgi:hypothetical protein
VKWNINGAAGNHIFHFGYNSAEYIPFTWTNGTGNPGSVYVATYHTDPLNIPYPPTVTHVRNNSGADNSANTVDRFWYINTSSTLAASANLTFKCTAGESSGISSLLAQRWVAPIVSWTNPVPGSQSSIANGTQANTISIFDNWWTLAGSANLLPVEMISFTGGCEGESTTLHWTTATEVNNDYFLLERSKDGQAFETVTTIRGNGNSSQAIDYSAVDPKPFDGITYYRIKQVDYDGHYEYFGPVKVRSCNEGSGITATIASLSSSSKEVWLQNATSGTYQFTLVSSEGKVISEWSLDLKEGFHKIPVDAALLSEGIYFIRIQHPTDFIVRKFTVYKN